MSNAAFIQTFVDWEITEGTIPITFSPYNAVTHEQIASFIVREQDKEANVSSDSGVRNVFKTGQRVFLFTKDEYGNVI